MRFTIITHVNHYSTGRTYYAYAPYVREMNSWFRYVDRVVVVAPAEKQNKSSIDLAYNHKNIELKKAPPFDTTNFKNTLKTCIFLPGILYSIFKAMQQADHIHLRCPGNMGLLGCFVQILFPKKKKSAKYAGNWDLSSKQPFTYKLQKWILNNPFLTRNIQVLVYGNWKGSSKNILPFFTASYSENEKSELIERSFEDVIECLFVGTLSKGKQPLYAIKLVEALSRKGKKVYLQIFGEGEQQGILKNYIRDQNLTDIIFLRGNQDKEILKQHYQKAHFLLLPSQSEGWPKAVAEAMFFGCLPIATPVSCLPEMLDHGKRGILLTSHLDADAKKISSFIDHPETFHAITKDASVWSRMYTTEKFEHAIQNILGIQSHV